MYVQGSRQERSVQKENCSGNPVIQNGKWGQRERERERERDVDPLSLSSSSHTELSLSVNIERSLLSLSHSPFSRLNGSSNNPSIVNLIPRR